MLEGRLGRGFHWLSHLGNFEEQSAVMVVLGINSSWKVGWLGVPLGVTSGQLMPSPGGHGHHWIITLQLGFYGSLKGFCGTVTRFTRADLPNLVFGKYLNPVKRLWAKHQGGRSSHIMVKH